MVASVRTSTMFVRVKKIGGYEYGVVQKVLFPGYTENRQSRASQGIPGFECNPDLNHAPATPYQRLLADPRTSETVRARVSALQATLDPVRLLSEIRLAQKQLVEIADRPAMGETAPVSAPTLELFLEGLRTSWQEGEVRPTSKPREKVRKYWRRCPDPFVAVTAQMREWFDAEPWRTSRELLERLQREQPDAYPDKLLRTLQRRVKVWRRENAHQLVFGAAASGGEPAQSPLQCVT